jgi:integrase
VRRRKVLGSLKQLIKDAQRRGTVAQNVASSVSIKLSKRHENKKLERGVDIPTPSGYARAVLIVAAFTGLRASELRGLPLAGRRAGRTAAAVTCASAR